MAVHRLNPANAKSQTFCVNNKSSDQKEQCPKSGTEPSGISHSIEAILAGTYPRSTKIEPDSTEQNKNEANNKKQVMRVHPMVFSQWHGFGSPVISSSSSSNSENDELRPENNTFKHYSDYVPKKMRLAHKYKQGPMESKDS